MFIVFNINMALQEDGIIIMTLSLIVLLVVMTTVCIIHLNRREDARRRAREIQLDLER